MMCSMYKQQPDIMSVKHAKLTKNVHIHKKMIAVSVVHL